MRITESEFIYQSGDLTSKSCKGKTDRSQATESTPNQAIRNFPAVVPKFVNVRLCDAVTLFAWTNDFSRPYNIPSF